MFLILAFIAMGIAAGWVAQMILGDRGSRRDWSEAAAAGLIGSFAGGLIFSLIGGDGLSIRPSGLIGSVIGAVVVLAIWRAIRLRRT
jgi:uncharacterized membrane protein YeaQ/YmgE (transglycosylase-associated protein family)